MCFPISQHFERRGACEAALGQHLELDLAAMFVAALRDAPSALGSGDLAVEGAKGLVGLGWVEVENQVEFKDLGNDVG